MRRDLLNSGKFCIRAEKGTFFLSSQEPNEESAPSQLSDIRSAIDKLNDFGDACRLREDAINNGKAIILNWHPPTNDQIDKIIDNMKKQLMA